MNYELLLNPSMIRPFVLRWKFNSRTVLFLGFALTISLIVFYVFQITAVTRLSFTIANVEKQVVSLDKEFKSLQINFSDKSSLSDLEEALLVKGYEKVGKIHYIQILEDTVAVK